MTPRPGRAILWVRGRGDCLKKVLIVGGNGFVGGRLAQAAEARGYEPLVADCADAPVLPQYRYLPVDITDEGSVERMMGEAGPELVVNVAAVADVDRAQADQPLAYAVNVTGTGNVAAAAKAQGAHLVWFSSDAVYAGTRACYRETDAPDPVNYYGVTKMLGEKAVLAECPDATVLRLSLVLGFPLVSGNSFVRGLADKLAGGQTVKCPVSEVRTPVDVETLCGAVLELGMARTGGLYNIGCLSSVDRYTLSRMLAVAMGYDEGLLEAQQAPDPNRAPRHRNGILKVGKLAAALKDTRLKTLEETVAAAVATRQGV